jgi:hypothetical protein
MATPWPQQPAWLTPFREHATRLSTYLQEALTCVDRTQSQPVPADLVKVIIHGTLTFILKVQHAPDLSTVCDSLSILQTEAKASSENAAQMLEAVTVPVRAVRGFAQCARSPKPSRHGRDMTESAQKTAALAYTQTVAASKAR